MCSARTFPALPPPVNQLAGKAGTGELYALPSVHCSDASTVLVADKPVFGADITLCEYWAEQSVTVAEVGQPLAWLSHDACAGLFLQGIKAPVSELFYTGQLILAPTRPLTVFRCRHLAYTAHLFCFSLTSASQCLFCTGLRHQRSKP